MSAQQDAFWGGRLTVWQPARGKGYRFNLDPVLLAGFVPAADTVVELGAGCGILSLLLLAMGKAQRVIAVERQPALAELCQRNAQENGFGGRFQVICADLRQATLPAADAVVFNPPYFPQGTGQGAPESGRNDARHERHGTLADFVATAFAALRPDGYVAAIVPAVRAAELATLMRAQGGTSLWRRDVTPRQGSAANHVLTRAAVATPAHLTIDPPLVVHVDASRTYTAEVAALVDGPPVPPQQTRPWGRYAASAG